MDKDTLGLKVNKEQFKFHAAHFMAILKPDGTVERERMHGHNYIVEVKVKGHMLEGTPYVMDFFALSEFT